MVSNKHILFASPLPEKVKQGRRILIGAYEVALTSVDPEKLVLEHCNLDLSQFDKIYVVGAGKAAAAMAKALEVTLGKRITEGFVNIPDDAYYRALTISAGRAGHPVPDALGVAGASRIIEIAKKAKERDLLITLISGGGSSMMPAPRLPVTLDDKIIITSALLKCGADVAEINTVRKHLSAIKGGWLARKALPATIINLILSDVIGDPLDFIASGPTVPDTTTFSDAVGILRKYGLYHKAPKTVIKLLLDGLNGLIEDTPKSEDKAFNRVSNIIIGNNKLAVDTICKHLTNAGINTIKQPSYFGESAKSLGRRFSEAVRIAKISRDSTTGNSRPIAIVTGGEASVTVIGNGIGGRCQETLLSATFGIEDLEGVVIAALATDGIDGPTDACGAIIDGNSLKRALSIGLEPKLYLENNNSYNFFKQLGDLVITGYTGTNVNDILMAIIL